jgi:antitoxin ParD1/3/4
MNVVSETLKADIARGLADVAAGRVKSFDSDRIVARGRALLASRLAGRTPTPLRS